MPPPAAPPRIWVLVDDRAGNRSQALGVAEALGLPFEPRDITYRWPAKLPGLLPGRPFAMLDAESRARLHPPWPDLVVAAGRRAGLVARAIKHAADGRTLLAQIMDPGAKRRAFDVIAIPAHDRLGPAANIVVTLGAPHRVTTAALAAAAETWRPRLASLPPPRIALLVGGSTRRRRFAAAMAEDLGRRASRMAAAAGGSLLVSTSRRTGEAAAAVLAALTVPYCAYRWGDGGENPYLGYLALADAVIVTGDSMSMCSEACATTAPVYIYAPAGYAMAKHRRLHDELVDRGYAQPLEAATALSAWTHPPLNAAVDIAAAVRRRLGV